ncbi:MAG: hypothetical protein JRM73_03050 [Nitrososphaerota archaeon]|nr:hypothetical protein [Nitrososphaerota archaeon]
MRKRSRAGVAVIVVVLAFIFLVPILRVDFITYSSPLGNMATQGYASISYWKLGIGGTYNGVNSTGYGFAVGRTPIFPPEQSALTGFGGNVLTGDGVFTASASSVQISADITADNPAKAVSFTYIVYPNPTSPEASSLCQKAVNGASNFTSSCNGLTVGDSYEVLVSATNCNWQVSVFPPASGYFLAVLS